jgi:hypothetical protein
MSEKRIIQLLTVFGIFAIGVILFVNYLFTPTRPISREQAYDLIAREVPMGASRIEVENWIDSKGWGERCGYMAKSLGTVSEDWFKGNLDEMKGYVSCFIADNSRTIWGSGDLVLVFYLNKDGNLIQYYCHQFSNSL